MFGPRAREPESTTAAAAAAQLAAIPTNATATSSSEGQSDDSGDGDDSDSHNGDHGDELQQQQQQQAEEAEEAEGAGEVEPKDAEEAMRLADEQAARDLAASWDIDFLHQVCVDPAFRLKPQHDMLFYDEDLTPTPPSHLTHRPAFPESTRTASAGTAATAAPQPPVAPQQYFQWRVEHLSRRALMDRAGQELTALMQREEKKDGEEKAEKGEEKQVEEEKEKEKEKQQQQQQRKEQKGDDSEEGSEEAAWCEARAPVLLSVLRDIATRLGSATLPRQQQLRAEMTEELNPLVIVPALRDGIMTFSAVRDIVLRFVRMLAAPSRDGDVKRVEASATPAAFLFNVVALLDSMQLDLANYILHTYRPLILQVCACVRACVCVCAVCAVLCCAVLCCAVLCCVVSLSAFLYCSCFCPSLVLTLPTLLPCTAAVWRTARAGPHPIPRVLWGSHIREH